MEAYLNKINKLDDLDYQILNILMQDSRTPYLEVARKCNVSGGTIHVRINKLEELGIIRGAELFIDTSKLGFEICSFVGIQLSSTAYINSTVDELSQIDEIVELYCTTGNYSIIVKIISKNISEFQQVLMNKIQSINGIFKTDVYISLLQPIKRNIKL